MVEVISGKKKYRVTEGSRCTVHADGVFNVYGLTEYGAETIGALLGPQHEGDRYHVFMVPPGVKGVLVRCGDRCRHVFQETPRPPKEELDPTPVEVPIGAQRPETLQETMQRLVHQEISKNAHSQGVETFEESLDFEVDEDPDPVSGFELQDMEEELFDAGSEPVDTPPEPAGEADGSTAPKDMEGSNGDPSEGEADPPGSPPNG